MDERCQICGDETGVQDLRTASAAGAARVLSVCTDCLQLRDAKQWSPDSEEGRFLKDTLEDGSRSYPQGRYTYLVDPSGSLHLVRLQRGWLDQHAETVGEA